LADQWPVAETVLLKHYVQQGWGPEEIREAMEQEGISKTFQSIRGKIRREQKHDPVGWHVRIAPPPECARKFNQQVKVSADSALLTGDWHTPFHNPRWGDQLIELGLKRKVEVVGIGGDLVDFSVFSKFGRQERVEAEDEIRAAEQIVSALAHEFKQVVYSGGNHEMRLPKATDNNLGLLDAMGMFVRAKNVTITDYHWWLLESGGRTFRTTHPKNASVAAGIVPSRLAVKYHMDIVGFHGHRWGVTMDPSNTWYCIDGGVCCDDERVAYVTKVDSIRPQACLGAVLIEDGIPFLLNPHNIGRY
jgi:hypothetical protein